MNTYLLGLAMPLTAYLAGSIPFGLLIVRWRTGSDVRQTGSGNIGATNVKRAAGTRWALATLVCDVLKGAMPTYAAAVLVGEASHWLPAATALAAVAGHMYPLYLRFKPSGKGVATTLGSLLVVAPAACLVSICVFIPVVYWSRRVSAGSLAAIFTLPPAAWFTTRDAALTAAAITIMALVIARHKDNIQRLAKGMEPRIGSR